jgi:hypothetical protein
MVKRKEKELITPSIFKDLLTIIKLEFIIVLSITFFIKIKILFMME